MADDALTAHVREIVEAIAETRSNEIINHLDRVAEQLAAQLEHLEARVVLNEMLTVAAYRLGQSPTTATSLAAIKREVARACAAQTPEDRRVEVAVDDTTVTTIVKPGADPADVLYGICQAL